jgi:putative ABC transport system permease protein
MTMEIRPIYSALMRNKAGLALIVLQVAITLAVVCNSLFIILDRAERVGRPSGMDEANTFMIRSLGFTPNYDVANATRQDLDAIRSMPGVVSATSTNTVPMSRGGWSTGIDKEPTDPTGARRSKSTALYFADERGVDAFGAKIIEGRDFTADEITEMTDESGITAKSIIVTKALADELFPGESAVGKQVYGIAGENQTVTIVGVVERLQQPWPGSRTVENSSLVGSRPLFGEFSAYLVRTEPGQRDRLMKEVETKLGEINTGRLLRENESVENVRAESYQQDRAMMTILLFVMGGMVLITGLGIVGLASFWVTRRIKQIGTRRALGARRFNIRGYFQTENGIMVTMGVALGIVLTYGFNLWLMQQYQAPRLPWFYLPIGALAVFALGQIAVLGPAGRAAKVPPAVATRTA